MKYRKFENHKIKEILIKSPKSICEKLMFLREMIFRIAEEHDEIGKIEETLKWNNPSYLTNNPKSGTTIRISNLQRQVGKYVISVHCQTNLIAEFKEVYPDLSYDGNRSIILDIGKTFPIDALQHFIYLALSYHHRKKHGIGI